MKLLIWRQNFAFGRIEAVVLALYSIMLGLALPFHEPWGDEAQAWLLARDNTFWQIFRFRLHYEGAPAEWHFLLRLLHLANVPWAAVPWVAVLFPIAGVYVLLRWSPFPILIRALLPFTFFLGYQYAVITRSYVLIPLLVFSLCALYTSSRRHILGFAAVAALLANVSMQGAVLSVGFAALYAWDLYRHRAGLSPCSRSQPRKRTLIPAAALLVASWVTCIYPAIPAPDVAFAIGPHLTTGLTHNLLLKIVGETPKVFPTDTAVRPSPQAAADRPIFKSSPRRWIAWQLNAPEATPPPNPQIYPAHTAPRLTSILAGEIIIPVIYTAVEIVSEAFWPISTSNLLACAFVLAVILWAHSRRKLLLFLPPLILLLVGEFLWVADHHAGLLFVALLASVWVAAPRHIPVTPVHDPPMRHLRILGRDLPTPLVDRAFLLLTTVVLILQIGWLAATLRAEFRSSYDPGRDTARFLLNQPDQPRVASFHFWAVSIEPYFEHNPFFNLPSSWWTWCTNADPDNDHRRVLDSHPDLVVFSHEQPLPGIVRNQLVPLIRTGNSADASDPVLQDLLAHKYVETHRFCGVRFSRISASYRVCDSIFQPDQSDQLRRVVAAQNPKVAKPSIRFLETRSTVSNP